MLHYDIKLTGTITGSMWWPVGVAAGKDINIDVTREAARFTETPTLREMVLHIIGEHGGDFGGDVRLTEDTTLTVTSRSKGRTLSREWPITAFPSIADCVALNVFGCDFCGCDDGEGC